jgi:hypothetical protein
MAAITGFRVTSTVSAQPFESKTFLGYGFDEAQQTRTYYNFNKGGRLMRDSSCGNVRHPGNSIQQRFISGMLHNLVRAERGARLCGLSCDLTRERYYRLVGFASGWDGD